MDFAKTQKLNRRLTNDNSSFLPAIETSHRKVRPDFPSEDQMPLKAMVPQDRMARLGNALVFRSRVFCLSILYAEKDCEDHRLMLRVAIDCVYEYENIIYNYEIQSNI